MIQPNKKPPRLLPEAAEGTAFAARHSTVLDPQKGWRDTSMASTGKRWQSTRRC
jgi:hypothetical protein